MPLASHPESLVGNRHLPVSPIFWLNPEHYLALEEEHTGPRDDKGFVAVYSKELGQMIYLTCDSPLRAGARVRCNH